MVFWENQKVVLAYYAQCVKPVCEAHGLTRMEFDILLFLANNPAYDTAADIVRIRMLTKITCFRRAQTIGNRWIFVHGISCRKSKDHPSVSDRKSRRHHKRRKKDAGTVWKAIV